MIQFAIAICYDPHEVYPVFPFLQHFRALLSFFRLIPTPEKLCLLFYIFASFLCSLTGMFM